MDNGRSESIDDRYDDDVLDIVNERDEVVGTATRRACHVDPSLAHRVAHVIVRNGEGEILLQRRATSRRIHPGLWDTSVGGHLDSGESYRQAAVRELREELGVVVDDVEHVHDYVWSCSYETEFVRTFRTVHDGPFLPDPHEIADLEFWPVDRIARALGTGVFTPNFEEEFRRLDI